MKLAGVRSKEKQTWPGFLGAAIAVEGSFGPSPLAIHGKTRIWKETIEKPRSVSARASRVSYAHHNQEKGDN